MIVAYFRKLSNTSKEGQPMSVSTGNYYNSICFKLASEERGCDDNQTLKVYVNGRLRGTAPIECVKHLFRVGTSKIVGLSDEVWAAVGAALTDEHKSCYATLRSVDWQMLYVEGTSWQQDDTEGDGMRTKSPTISIVKTVKHFYYDPTGKVEGPDTAKGLSGFWHYPVPQSVLNLARDGKENDAFNYALKQLESKLTAPKVEKSAFERFADQVGRVKVTFEGVEHTLALTVNKDVHQTQISLHKTRGKGWKERTHRPAKVWYVSCATEDYYENYDSEQWAEYLNQAKTILEKAVKELSIPKTPTGKPMPKKRGN